jgi:hypothetical protein
VVIEVIEKLFRRVCIFLVHFEVLYDSLNIFSSVRVSLGQLQFFSVVRSS